MTNLAIDRKSSLKEPLNDDFVLEEDLIARLGDCKTIWQRRRNGAISNRIGIPFTELFHWGKGDDEGKGSIRYDLKKCNEWRKNNPAQWDEMAAWRKQIQKIERMRGK